MRSVSAVRLLFDRSLGHTLVMKKTWLGAAYVSCIVSTACSRSHVQVRTCGNCPPLLKFFNKWLFFIFVYFLCWFSFMFMILSNPSLKILRSHCAI